MASVCRIVRPEKTITFRHLERLYKKTLQVLERIPKDSAYRINTERIICHRLSVVSEIQDTEQIEKTICCGSINSLFLQAEGEYHLCQTMLSYKPWEPLIESPPPCQWKWPHCAQ